jgi:hypothetical protein
MSVTKRKRSIQQVHEEETPFWRNALGGSEFEDFQFDFKILVNDNHIHPFEFQLGKGPLLVEIVNEDMSIIPSETRKLYYIPGLAEAETRWIKKQSSNNMNFFKVPFSDLILVFDAPSNSFVFPEPKPLNPPVQKAYSPSSQQTFKPVKEKEPLTIKDLSTSSSFLESSVQSLSVGDLIAVSYKNSAFATSPYIRQTIDSLNKNFA